MPYLMKSSGGIACCGELIGEAEYVELPGECAKVFDGDACMIDWAAGEYGL